MLLSSLAKPDPARSAGAGLMPILDLCILECVITGYECHYNAGIIVQPFYISASERRLTSSTITPSLMTNFFALFRIDCLWFYTCIHSCWTLPTVEIVVDRLVVDFNESQVQNNVK